MSEPPPCMLAKAGITPDTVMIGKSVLGIDLYNVGSPDGPDETVATIRQGFSKPTTSGEYRRIVEKINGFAPPQALTPP